jgi:hypothetical protein
MYFPTLTSLPREIDPSKSILQLQMDQSFDAMANGAFHDGTRHTWIGRGVGWGRRGEEFDEEGGIWTGATPLI